MLQSCRYPGPSGQEWERNSGVLPLVALVIVDQVCSSFSVSAVVSSVLVYRSDCRVSIGGWSHVVYFGCP